MTRRDMPGRRHAEKALRMGRQCSAGVVCGLLVWYQGRRRSLVFACGRNKNTILRHFVVHSSNSLNNINMCSDLGEGSRCCAGYSFVGALFTVSFLFCSTGRIVRFLNLVWKRQETLENQKGTISQ
jgi:hypothetical protein